QATNSTAVQAQREVCDDPRAEARFLAEEKRIPNPEYDKPPLAEQAEQRGDTSVSLEWLMRAYDCAQGPSTRVQWCVLFVE
ncbi:dihydroneopterin aldolase, partial [Stenotrophomonas maltophilia]